LALASPFSASWVGGRRVAGLVAGLYRVALALVGWFVYY